MMIKLSLPTECTGCGSHLPIGEWVNALGHRGYRCIECDCHPKEDERPTKKTIQSTEVSMEEQVNHPQHYGGADNPYEAIKVIEAWSLGFCLGNTVKYLSRAGKKEAGKLVEDLEKSAWYLRRQISDGTRRDFAVIRGNMAPSTVASAWGLSESFAAVLDNIALAVTGADHEFKGFLYLALNGLESEISDMKGATA